MMRKVAYDGSANRAALLDVCGWREITVDYLDWLLDRELAAEVPARLAYWPVRVAS